MWYKTIFDFSSLPYATLSCNNPFLFFWIFFNSLFLPLFSASVPLVSICPHLLIFATFLPFLSFPLYFYTLRLFSLCFGFVALCFESGLTPFYFFRAWGGYLKHFIGSIHPHTTGATSTSLFS